MTLADTDKGFDGPLERSPIFVFGIYPEESGKRLLSASFLPCELPGRSSRKEVPFKNNCPRWSQMDGQESSRRRSEVGQYRAPYLRLAFDAFPNGI